jgi:hypothetical protein
MTSVRETILAEVATRLAATATDLDYGFERNRLAEVEGDDLPMLVMYDGGLQVIDGDVGGLWRQMPVTVSAYVAPLAEADLGPDISAVVAAIETSIRPDGDVTLGGLAGVKWTELLEMSDPVFSDDQDTRPHAVFDVVFAVTFATAEFDPSVAD